jgi:hypothetical protein
MKNVVTLLFVVSCFVRSQAQSSMKEIMEQRAREMYRVIGLSDKAQWKTFVKENYSEALIDKPMVAKIQTDENGQSTGSEVKTANNLEAKAAMFERLHNDFGESKIVSLKSGDANLEMILRSSDGNSAKFNFNFQKETPYLISSFSVEAGIMP